MKVLPIVLLSIGAAILYGIVHDQITARVCIEYFTIGHPRLIESESPTVLGLLWGVIATWWVGFGLGLPLAIASRAGGWPRLEWRDHVRGLRALLLVMALLAAAAGLVTWFADPSGLTTCEISGETGRRYVAVGAAHLLSYGAGFLGGLTLIIRTILRRKRLA